MKMEDDNHDILCGFGTFRPKWLQWFATNRWYLFVHCCLASTQGMLFSYMSAILSTMEKEFGIRSEYSAYVMSGNELSQILLVFSLPAINRVEKRPLWIAIGMMLSVLGCFLITFAHLTSDPLKWHVDSSLEGGQLASQSFSLAGQLCSADSSEEEKDTCSQANQEVNVPGIALIFLGLFLTGFGNTVFFSLSITYLDDNVPRRLSPFLLSISFVVRLLGPVLGVGLSSLCLRLYVNPGSQPPFGEDDERWIGAWWLGAPVIGTLTFLWALLVCLFPIRLPPVGNTITDAVSKAARKEKKQTDPLWNNKEELVKCFHDGKATLGRLFTNKVYVLLLISGVTTMFCFAGFGIFIPKFYQIWFRFKASNAGIGMAGTLVGQCIGTIASGAIMSRFRPSARYVSIWNAFVSLMFVLAIYGVSYTDCQRSMWFDNDSCIPDCECPNKFNPVCSNELNMNFFSACSAGCQNTELGHQGVVTYDNCTCIQKLVSQKKMETFHPQSMMMSDDDDIFENGFVTKGECYTPDGTCEQSFVIFLSVMVMMTICLASGRIGNMLLLMRCIDVHDKAVALAVISATVSLFGQLPGPLVYGFLFDYTCVKFRTDCDGLETGDCIIYDTDMVRNWVLRLTALLAIIPTFFDVCVVFHVGKCDLYSDPNVDEEEPKYNVAETTF